MVLYYYAYGDPDKDDDSTSQIRSGILCSVGIFDSKRHIEKAEFLQRKVNGIMKHAKNI